MSATTTASTVAPQKTTERTPHPVLRATAVAAVAGATATTAFAAVAHAGGVPFEVDGEAIPLGGFAMMTAIGAVLGGILLALANRFTAQPHRRFLQVAVVLTALTCIPSVLSPPDTATKLALVASHLLAAVVIVPVLVRRARPAHR